MIRLAHLSDSHFDERGRLEDVVAVHRAFLDQAREAQVDLIVHAGDWFERRSTPAERNAVADFLIHAARVAPVFGVKGNHDQPGDLDIFNRLTYAVDILDRPTAAPGSALSWITPGSRKPKLGFLALPWFDKAHLVSQLDATVDAEATRRMTIEAARNLLTAFRAEAARLKSEGAVPIFVSHTMVSGSEVSTGQTIIGTTVELAPADLLDIGASYVALGHVHKHQRWFDGRVAYSGSPHRCNFGEAEPKGWCLVTLEDDGTFLENRFMELPARRIVRLEADLTKDWMLQDVARSPNLFSYVPGFDPETVKGALVRYRYRVLAQHLHAVDVAALEKLLLQAGAAEVQIEAVVEHENRARAPEIVSAKSTLDKVQAFFDAKGIEVGPEQALRLQAKLAGLEAQ